MTSLQLFKSTLSKCYRLIQSVSFHIKSRKPSFEGYQLQKALQDQLKLQAVTSIYPATGYSCNGLKLTEEDDWITDKEKNELRCSGEDLISLVNNVLRVEILSRKGIA
ncbi:hypothetical protein GRJ2_002381500 [Grus japonensis]|uniref:Uncharacterized protein n=1 Tax=Grus japonensis TaxID=30415 RepID=A0ABC9XPC1_GRUJA